MKIKKTYIKLNFRWVLLFTLLSTQSLAQLSTSNLPIFIFNTNGQSIEDEPKINAELKIVYDSNGGINNVNSTTFHYDSYVGVEYSGSFTQFFPKKNLNIELRSGAPDYDSQNVSLFGFPEENDFILVANYLDPSHSKNALSQYLYKYTNSWSPKTIHCEVVVNGAYQGLYLFCEKIKRDKNRVDIKKLDENDLTLPDISGGYLFVNQNNDPVPSGEGWSSSINNVDPKTFEIKYPNPPETVQRDYIKNYVDQLEGVLNAPGYENPTTGYRSMIDESTFFDYIIIHELAKNSGAYHRDVYFSKERGEKLNIATIWDFDFAYGRKFFDNVEPTTDFRLSTPSNSQLFWFSKLKEDCIFIEELNEKYELSRETFLTTANINTYLDSLNVQISAAALRDKNKWFPSETITFNTRIQDVKNWIANRITWMDTNYYDIGGNAPDLAANTLTINKNASVTFTISGCQNNNVTWEIENAYESSTLSTTSNTLSIPLSVDSKVMGTCQTTAICPIASNKISITVNDNCEQNITINSLLPIVPIYREYKAVNTITALSDLESHKVHLVAGKSISLNQGFKINAADGGFFIAEIKDCP